MFSSQSVCFSISEVIQVMLCRNFLLKMIGWKLEKLFNLNMTLMRFMKMISAHGVKFDEAPETACARAPPTVTSL